jgi:hypothetical protein
MANIRPICKNSSGMIKFLFLLNYVYFHGEVVQYKCIICYAKDKIRVKKFIIFDLSHKQQEN